MAMILLDRLLECMKLFVKFERGKQRLQKQGRACGKREIVGSRKVASILSDCFPIVKTIKWKKKGGTLPGQSRNTSRLPE